MHTDVKTGISLDYDQARLMELCRKWMIDRFAVFGSVARGDFSEDSDVDVLLDFSPEAPWGLGEIVLLRSELEGFFGRPVDIVERSALRNPYRKREILAEQRVVYEAARG